MKVELTNPTAWKKISEKRLPMESKIKIYEKVGGAYRLGKDEGEQVYNKLSELLKSVMDEYSLPKANIQKKTIKPADLESSGGDVGASSKSNASKMASSVKSSASSIRATKVNEAGEDHEVGMAMGQLDDIIKNANELKAKIGTQEMNLPGWIQDHISQSQNFINQANTGYHTLNDKEKK